MKFLLKILAIIVITHKQILTEMDNTYRCMRTLKVTDGLISKTNDQICKRMSSWRELKLHVTPSAYLFEDHIVYQMEYIVGGLADKREDNIERSHQDGKRSERIHIGLINFQQFQVTQLKNKDMITNLQVKLKSHQIKTNGKEI